MKSVTRRIVLMAGRDARPEFPVGPFYVKGCALHGFVMFAATAAIVPFSGPKLSGWCLVTGDDEDFRHMLIGASDFVVVPGSEANQWPATSRSIAWRDAAKSGRMRGLPSEHCASKWGSFGELPVYSTPPWIRLAVPWSSSSPAERRKTPSSPAMTRKACGSSRAWAAT